MRHLVLVILFFPIFLFSVFASDEDEGLRSLLTKPVNRAGTVMAVFRDQLKSSHIGYKQTTRDLSDTNSVIPSRSQSFLGTVGSLARNGISAGVNKGTDKQSEIPLEEVAELQESVAAANNTVVLGPTQNASNQTAFHPPTNRSASISNATTIVHSELNTTSSTSNVSATADLTVKPTASSCNASTMVENASEILITVEREIHPSTKQRASICNATTTVHSPYNASAMADLAVNATKSSSYNAKPMVHPASKLPTAAEWVKTTESNELGMSPFIDLELTTTVEHGRSGSDNSFPRESSPLKFWLYLFGAISATLVIASLVIIWWCNPISLCIGFNRRQKSSIVFIDRLSLERCDPERQFAVVNMNTDVLYPFSTSDRLEHPDVNFGTEPVRFHTLSSSTES